MKRQKSKIEQICMYCVHAKKRSAFDLSRYGLSYAPFECLVRSCNDSTASIYKRPHDTCEYCERKK